MIQNKYKLIIISFLMYILSCQDRNQSRLASWKFSSNDSVAFLIAEKKTDNALKILDRLIKQDGLTTDNANLLSMAYLDQQNYDSSLKYLNIVDSLHLYRDYKAPFLIGICKMLNKDTLGALPYYERSLDINPNNIEGLYGRALCNLRLNKIDIVKRDLQQIQKFNPNYKYSKIILDSIKDKRKAN